MSVGIFPKGVTESTSLKNTAHFIRGSEEEYLLYTALSLRKKISSLARKFEISRPSRVFLSRGTFRKGEEGEGGGVTFQDISN